MYRMDNHINFRSHLLTSAPEPLKPTRFLMVLFLLLMLRLPVSAQETATPIAYHLTVSEVIDHRFQVRVTVPSPPEGKAAFAIPAWSPGYYQILHFEKSIENVQAEDEKGKPLPVSHPSARLWEVTPSQKAETFSTPSLTLTYDVHAQDEGYGFFGSVLNTSERHGYVNGASALMYLVGQAHTPTTLTVTLPPQWKLATPLKLQKATQENRLHEDTHTEQISTFQAKDYEELIDCPLQFGRLLDIPFTVEGVPFHCVVVGKQTLDKPRLLEALQSLTRPAIQMFGSAPFPTYTFFFHCGGSGFIGGLEHRSSTVIHWDKSLGDGSDENFQALTSHEYFHAWNVKRLRPAPLGPFDLTQPVRTHSLWWAEGVTDYYAPLLLVRSGLRDREWFLKTMRDRIAELDNTPARGHVSLEEASYKSWEGASEGFDGLSYYLKGSLVGFYFDIRIRQLTYGRKSLDDVMRKLEAEYGKPDKGYPEDGLLNAINSITDTDLKPEYDRFVRGTEDIPWERVLPSIGLTFHRESTAFLGLRLVEETVAKPANAPTVEKVEKGLAGAKMDIRAGDKLLRVNGMSTEKTAFATLMRSLPPFHTFSLDIEREGQPLTLSGTTGVRYSQQELRWLPDGQVSLSIRQNRKTLFQAKPGAGE